MLRPLLTLNQRVVGSSPTGLTSHIWDLDILQIPYFVAYGQRFGRDFTESAAHFGAFLLSAWPHLPGKWAPATPLACRRRVTHGPHRIRTSFASTPAALRSACAAIVRAIRRLTRLPPAGRTPPHVDNAHGVGRTAPGEGDKLTLVMAHLHRLADVSRHEVNLLCICTMPLTGRQQVAV